MIAQRTTLMTLCLATITLVFGVDNRPTVKLPATEISVSYVFALYTLLTLVVLNGVSYIWRFYAIENIKKEERFGAYQRKMHDQKIIDHDAEEERFNEQYERLQKIIQSEPINSDAADKAKSEKLHLLNQRSDRQRERSRQQFEGLFRNELKHANWIEERRKMLFDAYLPGFMVLASVASVAYEGSWLRGLQNLF